jgi:hypothetical protein
MSNESGFYLLPAVVKTYAPCGETPILPVYQTRDHLSVMSGIRGLSSNWTESRVKPSSCYERGPWGRLVEILRRIAQRP